MNFLGEDPSRAPLDSVEIESTLAFSVVSVSGAQKSALKSSKSETLIEWTKDFTPPTGAALATAFSVRKLQGSVLVWIGGGVPIDDAPSYTPRLKNLALSTPGSKTTPPTAATVLGYGADFAQACAARLSTRFGSFFYVSTDLFPGSNSPLFLAWIEKQIVNALL